MRSAFYTILLHLLPVLLFTDGNYLRAQVDSTTLFTDQADGKKEVYAKKLVKKLIAGKTGELEQFDAIFTWVATNIRYDYRQYYSGEGTSVQVDIGNILKRKRAICMQYTVLMDSLCSFAGIRSVTVNGYAKDLLFDINDSLYFDNHAWNAVNLNNKWYVYDVTWSAGGYTYRLTRWSERVKSWRENIRTRRMKMRKHVIKIKHPGNALCHIRKHTEKKVRYVQKLPFFWRLMDGLLSKFRLRQVIDNNPSVNRNYYLTDPRLFAATHFPNVPYWSLTPEISSIRDFSADESYHLLDEDPIFAPNLAGSDCEPCDRFLTLTPAEKDHERVRESLLNNPRNGVEPANAHFNLANRFFESAYRNPDTLQKIQEYDSTLFHFIQAQLLLKRSQPQNNAFHRFHFEKEDSKVRQLRDSNRVHLARNAENVSQLRSRTNKMRRMRTQIGNYQRVYLRNYQTVARYRLKNPGNQPMRDKTAEIVRERIDYHEQRIDSINSRIGELQTELLDRIHRLADQSWEQTKLLAPQNAFFIRCANSRLGQLKDDRHPTVQRYQDTIRFYEQALKQSITQQLFLPSDTLFVRFRELDKSVRLRDGWQLDALKEYNRLYVGRNADTSEIGTVKRRYQASIAASYCYFFEHRLPIADLMAGHAVFRKEIYRLYSSVKTDTKSEIVRHKAFLKEILLTKKRVRKVIQHNLKYEAGLSRKVREEQKQWKQLLRNERKRKTD